MAEKNYSVGQRVFIISNNSYVMEMQIMRISGDFYTLRSVETYGSGMRLKGHRLYVTKEEAELFPFFEYFDHIFMPLGFANNGVKIFCA